MTTKRKLELAILRGDVKTAEKFFYELKEEEDRAAWLEQKRAEFESLYPKREMTEDEKVAYDAENFSDENPKPEGFEYPLVDTAPFTFSDWLSETKTVTKTRPAIAEDGTETTEEYTEKESVRPYTFDKSKYDFTPLRSQIQLKTLQDIFVEKYEGIKKVVADKDGDEKYIQAQSEVYEYMKECAEKKFFDDDTNYAIIKANTEAKYAVNRILLLLNEVRSILQKKIENGQDISNDLLKVKGLSYDVFSEVTPDENLQDAMIRLGII